MGSASRVQRPKLAKEEPASYCGLEQLICRTILTISSPHLSRTKTDDKEENTFFQEIRCVCFSLNTTGKAWRAQTSQSWPAPQNHWFGYILFPSGFWAMLSFGVSFISVLSHGTFLDDRKKKAPPNQKVIKQTNKQTTRKKPNEDNNNKTVIQDFEVRW